MPTSRVRVGVLSTVNESGTAYPAGGFKEQVTDILHSQGKWGDVDKKLGDSLSDNDRIMIAMLDDVIFRVHARLAAKVTLEEKSKLLALETAMLNYQNLILATAALNRINGE